MSDPVHDRDSELAELLREVRELRKSIDRLKPGVGQALPPEYAVAVRIRPELPPDYAVAVKIRVPGEAVINPPVIAHDVDE